MMTGDGLWEAQQAIYARLVAVDIAGGNVFDHTPQSVSFPSVEIGEWTADEADVDGFSGTDAILTLHAWSRDHRGQRQVLEIVSAIKAELHNTELAVSGRTALVWWAGSRTVTESDGLTRHGIIRLRISSYEEEN